MYAWLITEADETEGIIAALLPGVGAVAPLQSRHYDIAISYTGIALGAGRAAGRPVRLVRLVEDRS
jgi:hypothetical protein